jgi:hypothetical protein
LTYSLGFLLDFFPTNANVPALENPMVLGARNNIQRFVSGLVL